MVNPRLFSRRARPVLVAISGEAKRDGREARRFETAPCVEEAVSDNSIVHRDTFWLMCDRVIAE